MFGISALFSGVAGYVSIGAIVVALAAGGFGLWERGNAADLKADNVTLDGKYNQMVSVHDTDLTAISDLERNNRITAETLATMNDNVAHVTDQLTGAQMELLHAPSLKDCQSLDPRDLIAIDGVRRILGAPAAPHPDESGEDAPAAGTSPLPAPASHPVKTRDP